MFVNLIVSTIPFLTCIVAFPPDPSPIIGTSKSPSSAASTETVPLLLITIVSNFPSTDASFIGLVATSPHFSGKGMYVFVTNLTMSAGDIV